MARTKLGNVLHWALDNYPNVVPISECSFNGVYNPADPDYECDRTWTQSQREMLARAIYSAIGMIEPQLGFYVSRQYTVDEEHLWGCPIQLDHGYVVGQGNAATTIMAATASNFTGDPYTITMTLPAGTLASEIHFYETSTGYELNYTSYSQSGAVVVYSFPKCRMAKWANLIAATETTPIQYTDATAFLAIGDITIKRVYRDCSGGVEMLWPGTELCTTAGPCDYVSVAGCMLVHDAQIGVVSVSPATYSAGAWTLSCTSYCTPPEKVRVDYLSGLAETPTQLEDAIVRLAHTLMPVAPCGCASISMYWDRDREKPPVLTREVINNPFGIMAGAYFAWSITQMLRIGHGGLLTGNPKRPDQCWGNTCVSCPC